MAAASTNMEAVISHWNHLYEGMQFSSQDFYGRVEAAIKAREIPDARFSRIELSEGGLFSSRRSYLRIHRKEHYFDICGAPFGRAFFVSWWLCNPPSGCLMFLLTIPVVNVLTMLFMAISKPSTYYQIDTALMFQDSVHNAVLEVLDDITTAQGIRALADGERKPLMRELYPGRK